jgi:hypothetical protein
MFRVGLVAATFALATAASLAPQAHADNVSDFVAKWDPDHDGTLDIAEINKAADAAFDTLDVDHDGTLDRKELGIRVTPDEFTAADTDHEGTLDKAEYRSIVAKRFHAANPDNDTTIEATELKTTAGAALLYLLT